jgi:hypothetical protein
MAINRAGNLPLVARSVLSISGKTVAVVGTVALAPADAPSQQPSAVAITADGKRALVAKALANKVALLYIDGTTVTYKGYDMITGLFPFNVQITADGTLGLVNHNGNAGVADGHVSTASWLDQISNVLAAATFFANVLASAGAFCSATAAVPANASAAKAIRSFFIEVSS